MRSSRSRSWWKICLVYWNRICGKGRCHMRPQPDSSRTFKRRIILALLAITVVLLALVGVVEVNRSATSKQAKTSSPSATAPSQNRPASRTPTAQVSPLLFGTNLGLFTGNDQVITSTTTRDLMQQIHIRIVRIPLRAELPNAIEVQAEQAVKSTGAIPLVTLDGLRNAMFSLMIRA